MMDNKIRKISTAILLALSCVAFHGVSALEYKYDNDNTSLSTEDKNIGVNISAIEKDESNVEIVITLTKSKKIIISQIDYLNKNLIINSVSQSNRPVALTEGDILQIKILGKKFHEDEVDNKKIGEALGSLLGFLYETPPNTVIQINTGKTDSLENQQLSPSNLPEFSIVSLCSATGDRVSGSFTVGAKPFQKTVALGPCYNEANACLGRCGPGCDAPPAVRVQQFTQDCLDHDLCTQKTRQIFGPCTDEWIAAADDFFFAPDCGNMTGQWTEATDRTDNNLLWTLSEDHFTGLITGSADDIAVSCAWNVNGEHTGADSVLNAVNSSGSSCASYFYTGTASDCDTVKGTWSNIADPTDSGTYTLTREQ